MRKAISIWLAVAPGAPALAEDVFQRPADCKLVATTQRDNCEVENVYACGTVESPIVRTESFDALGLYSVAIDQPEQNTYSTDFVGGDGSFRLEYIGDEALDVIRKGSGASTATGEFQAFGLRREFTASSTSSYAGQSVELAGKSFQQIENELRMQLPYPIPEIRGTEIIAFSEEMQLSLSLETKYDDSASFVEGSKLVKVSLPGQSGFGDEYPLFGCANLSSEQGSVFSGMPS